MPDEAQDDVNQELATDQTAGALGESASGRAVNSVDPESVVDGLAAPGTDSPDASLINKSAFLFWMAATAFGLWLAYLGWVALKVIYP